MPITSGQNNYLRRDPIGPTAGNLDLTVIPVGGVAGQIAAGDMVYLTAAKLLASLNTPGASNANAASFVGVSIDNYPLVIAQGVTEGPAYGETPTIALRTGGEFMFYTTAGDTYGPGDVVYLGADAQTVTKIASGTAIGRVVADMAGAAAPGYVQGMPISTPIVGGTGVLVPVRIAPAIVI